MKQLGLLQAEALEAIANGHRQARAAHDLGICQPAFKWRLRTACNQLNASTTIEAVAIAASRGLIKRKDHMPELLDIYMAAALPEAIRQVHRRQAMGDNVDVPEEATNLAVEVAQACIRKRNEVLNA